MKKFLIEYPILVKEWHPTKNGSMTPKKFTHGSNKVSALVSALKIKKR